MKMHAAIVAATAAVAAARVAEFDAYLEEFAIEIDDSEYDRRAAIFASNLKRIEEHNADKTSGWQMGVTKFAHLTFDEFGEQVANGYNKDIARSSSVSEALGAEEADLSEHVAVESLPRTVDYRTANPAVLTPVKNQGGCGSCWAFASTETAESHLAINQGKLLVLAPQQLVDCAPNPDHCGGTGGCQGSTAELAYNYTIHSAGLLTEEQYPYTAQTQTCKAESKKPVATLGGYVTLPTNNVTALQNAVAQQPIAISVAASAWALYSGGIFDSKQCGTDVNHLVQLVGYGTDSGTDYWIVRNSWGSSWGEEGFIRIKRFTDDSTPCALDKTPLDGYACEGQTDPIKVCGLCGMLSDSVYPTGGKIL